MLLLLLSPKIVFTPAYLIQNVVLKVWQLTQFARYFEEHCQKHQRQWFFQKHRQNISSLRKKHNVLHDVLGIRNAIQFGRI